MPDNAAVFNEGRRALEAALSRAAAELARMDANAPVADFAAMARHVAALQQGLEALERAIVVGQRYQPSYFGDT